MIAADLPLLPGLLPPPETVPRAAYDDDDVDQSEEEDAREEDKDKDKDKDDADEDDGYDSDDDEPPYRGDYEDDE